MTDDASPSLHMTLCERDTVYDDCIFLRQGAQDHAGLTLVLSCYHFYLISFFYVHTKIVIRLQGQATR